MPATPESNAHKTTDTSQQHKPESQDHKVYTETQKKEDQKAQLHAESLRHDKDSKGLAPVEIKGADGANVQLNEKGKVTKVTDKAGKTREFGYDESGKINSYKDETGTWTSKDGKSWTNEKGESRKFEVSVTKDGTTQIKESGKVYTYFGNGKTQIENKDGGVVTKDEKGRVVETKGAKGSNKFEYGNDGKLQAVTTTQGERWTSKDGKNFECNGRKAENLSVDKDGTLRFEIEGKIVYRRATGSEKIIESNGRITEDGKETQPAFSADKLARIGKSLDAIAYACNGGIAIGTDEKTIYAELGDKTEAELLVMKRMWKENAAKGKKNYDTPTLEAEMRDELSGAELDRALNMINKRDGMADSAGRIHTAIGERGQLIFGRNNSICEKDIRDTLAKSNSEQIAEMDQDYRRRYGVGLRDAILNDKHVSQGTKDAVDIYLKGNDKRTLEDTQKLADIACKTKNIDMFQEAMRTAPQKARDEFVKNGGDYKILHAFGKYNGETGIYSESDDSRHARDYARIGKESTANIVRDNSSMFGDSEDGIKKALKDMTPEERKLYAQGRKIATGEGDVDLSKLSEADKKKATDYYKDLHGALDAAANATEMREWEAIITHNGKADFISTLASKKSMVGWDNVDDIVGTIEKMPKEDWERLKKEAKEGKSTYRDEIVKTLGTYLNKGELKRCTDVLDKKIACKDFDDAQKHGKRDALTAMKDARGWFNNNEDNILNAIRTMSKEEQQKYRTDENYRKEIDRQVFLGLDPGAELEAGRYMLDQIKQGKSPDTLTAKLLIHAQNTNTDEAQVVRDVDDAFRKDPELKRIVTNPQTEAERKISEEVKDALKKALGPLDYINYGEPLLKTGTLSAEKRQDLNRGFFDDDEQGCYKDLLRVSESDRQKILTNKEYANELLAHLSESERELALNNLREYDRLSKDKTLTPEQRKESMDAMLQGEMRPEDKLRSYMLGAGTNDDGIKEVLKDLSPEQAQKVREDYERKYGSLTAAFVDELSGTELENALDQVRRKGTQDEEFDYYRDHFYYNTRGLGREAVDETWNGTGFQTDEAFNRYFNAISEANRQDMKLTVEQQKQLQESLKEAAEELQKSKAELANTTADIAITLAAFIPGGQAAALLRFARMATIMGMGGGLTKVLLKTALLGDGYSMSNAGLDFAAGFTDGALNVVGGGHLGKILKVGDKAATKAACKTVEELSEKSLIRAGKLTKVVMEDGTEKFVSQKLIDGSRCITSEAIAQGSKQFDEKAIKTVAKELVNHEVAEKATKEALARGLTRELAEKEGKQALAKAEEEIARVLEKHLKQDLTLETRSFARRFLSDVGANTFNGAAGAGASGAITSLAQWDSTKSLEENLQMVMTAFGTSAATGAIMGFGMSSIMKSGMQYLENRAGKAASHLPAPHEPQAGEKSTHGFSKPEMKSADVNGTHKAYDPPISATGPKSEFGTPREVAPGTAHGDKPFRRDVYSPIREKGERVFVDDHEWQWVHYDDRTSDAIVQRIGNEKVVKVDVRLDARELRPVRIEGREYQVDKYGAVWQPKGEGFYGRVFQYQVVSSDRISSPTMTKRAMEQMADWGSSRRQLVQTADFHPVDMYGNAALVVSANGLPQEGLRIPLNESTVPLGRNHLGAAFENANLNISSEHLQVSWDAKEQLYYIKDNSTNGTYIRRKGESEFTYHRGDSGKVYIGPDDEIRLARIDGPQVRLDLPQAQMYARPSQVPQNLDAQFLVGGKQISAQHTDTYILGRDFQNIGESDAINRQVAHYHGHINWNSEKGAFEYVDLTMIKPEPARGRKGATVLINENSQGNGSYLIRNGQEYLLQKHGTYGNTTQLFDGDRIRLGSRNGPEVKVVLNKDAQTLADGRVLFQRADGTTAIKRPDGTVRIDNPMAGARVEDSTGRVLETNDIYGRLQRYHYDQQGRLNAVVSDDGSVLATVDGATWKQTYRDGRSQSFGGHTFDVDSDGALKMHNPATRETKIYRLDGTVETVDRNGRVNYTESHPVLERNRLFQHATRFSDREQQARFVSLMQQFEARVQREGLPVSEVAVSFHHLNRILQAGDSAMLNETERLRLSEMILNHMVNPQRIDQGQFPTCNVSVLEKRLYAKKPSEAVRLLADVVETGKYVTASGTVIDLSRVPQALAPDAQAQAILRHGVDPHFGRDLQQDNVRTWASQIFENTSANIKWLKDGEFRRHPEDVILYEHIAGTHGDGRLVRYSVDYRGNRVREELQAPDFNDGKIKPISGPQVYASDLNRIYNEIAGGNDSRFVIIGPNIPKSALDIGVASQKEFERSLQELLQRKDFPAVIMVNTNNKLFGYVGGQHSWHVVNIQNAYYDRVRGWMVEYTNQWGRNADRMGPNAVSAKELYEAAVGPSHGYVVNQHAAAASSNGTEGLTLSQLNQNAIKGEQTRPEIATAVARHHEGIREDSAASWNVWLDGAKKHDPEAKKAILEHLKKKTQTEIHQLLTSPVTGALDLNTYNLLKAALNETHLRGMSSIDRARLLINLINVTDDSTLVRLIPPGVLKHLPEADVEALLARTQAILEPYHIQSEIETIAKRSADDRIELSSIFGFIDSPESAGAAIGERIQHLHLAGINQEFDKLANKVRNSRDLARFVPVRNRMAYGTTVIAFENASDAQALAYLFRKQTGISVDVRVVKTMDDLRKLANDEKLSGALVFGKIPEGKEFTEVRKSIESGSIIGKGKDGVEVIKTIHTPDFVNDFHKDFNFFDAVAPRNAASEKQNLSWINVKDLAENASADARKASRRAELNRLAETNLYFVRQPRDLVRSRAIMHARAIKHVSFADLAEGTERLHARLSQNIKPENLIFITGLDKQGSNLLVNDIYKRVNAISSSQFMTVEEALEKIEKLPADKKYGKYRFVYLDDSIISGGQGIDRGREMFELATRARNNNVLAEAVVAGVGGYPGGLARLRDRLQRYHPVEALVADEYRPFQRHLGNELEHEVFTVKSLDGKDRVIQVSGKPVYADTDEPTGIVYPWQVPNNNGERVNELYQDHYNMAGAHSEARMTREQFSFAGSVTDNAGVVIDNTGLAFRGGAPTGAQLDELADQFNVIFDLRESTGALRKGTKLSPEAELKQIEAINQKRVAAGLKPLEYRSLPLSTRSATPITQAEINSFITTMDQLTAEGKRVYIHCEHGCDRTGLMVALYEISKGGDPLEVFARMQAFGFNEKLADMRQVLIDYANTIRFNKAA